jgi:O-antigen/teichoic acid export membrane protein
MSLLKDSVKVLSGITVQRVLNLIMLPIIARLVGPKDYGIFSIALSICALCSIISGFALEASIAVSVSRKEAAERTLGTALIGIVSGMLLWFITLSLYPFLKNYYSTDVLNALLIMLPVFVPLTIISISMQNYIGYLDKFIFFTISDISAPLVSYATLISTYFLFWKDYRSLIAGGIMALVIRITLFIYASKKSHLFMGHIIRLEIFRSLWKARNFVKFNLPSNILNTSNEQLPPVLLSMVFPESIVGLYAMARNIITIPTSLSGKALGQVFYPKAAKEYRDTGSFNKITWQTFVYSCQLTLFPALFTAAIAGFILPILLGPKWDGIVPFILLLLPMVLLNAVQTQIGIGYVFSILKKQYKILIGNILLFTFSTLPLIFCIITSQSAYVSVFMLSIGKATGYAFLLVWIFTSLSISIHRALFTWLKYFLISLVCVMPIIGAVWLLKNFILLIWLSIVISMIAYGLFAWFMFLSLEQRAFVMLKIYPKFSLKKR